MDVSKHALSNGHTFDHFEDEDFLTHSHTVTVTVSVTQIELGKKNRIINDFESNYKDDRFISIPYHSVVYAHTHTH